MKILEQNFAQLVPSKYDISRLKIIEIGPNYSNPHIPNMWTSMNADDLLPKISLNL